ncbi:ANTAR domain-containing protein [Streptomyces canus]|uniref:ANTAR domain-containing protein n=1 Tax=Streptomyces canus TaxID=58343 RepID=UPI00371430E0
MTTFGEQRHLTDGARDATPAELQREIVRLRQAITSHQVIDQAIGVLIAVHQLPPTAGFEVLCEVSQRTNIKLHAVAETVIA